MEDFARLRVRLTPKSGRDALVKREAGVLYARVCAPPVDGAANRALIALLSESLHIARSRITFHTGETSRDKVVQFAGLTPEALDARLADALPEGP